MLSDAWAVLAVFLIPFGGGIPGGVLLASQKGFQWPMMTVLYFISDIILAFIFEGIVIGVRHLGTKHTGVGKFNAAMKESMDKTIARYGLMPGPFTLIAIAFGVDPMTGRTAALAAGHGFVTGWALAIIGDMFYFAILMASTLWLKGILGDGTWTTIIILVLMMVIPKLIQSARERWPRRRA